MGNQFSDGRRPGTEKSSPDENKTLDLASGKQPDALTDGTIVLEEILPSSHASKADEARTLECPPQAAQVELELISEGKGKRAAKSVGCYESFTGLDRIDGGGQGTIYRAKQAGMNREVVIKWAEGNS